MADPDSPVRDWAVYVYFAVDVPEAPLHESAVRNLVQMATLGSSPEVGVAAQIDLPGMLTRRYVLPQREPGSGAPVVPPAMSIPNVNSADPRSILDFICWAAQECPARNTMLVLWGHGYGLDDYVPPGAHLHSPGRGINALRMAAPSPRSSSNPANPKPNNWYAAIFDAHAREVIPNQQVASAILSALPALPQKKAAILGWASCEMAMAEVWSELAQCADYGVASQTPVPYQDWPLDRILRGLLLNPKSDARTVAQMVANAFLESYAHQGDYVAISAVDLPRMQVLQQAIRPLAEALKEAALETDNLPPVFEARNYCPTFDPDGFIDLGCFCSFLRITMSDTNVSRLCDEVLSALRDFVVTAGYSPRNPTTKLSQSTGLSVWFPSWIQNPSVKMMEKDRSMAYLANGYPGTAFAQATGWDQFLVAIRDTAEKERLPATGQ
jgi:hypothetical protein